MLGIILHIEYVLALERALLGVVVLLGKPIVRVCGVGIFTEIFAIVAEVNRVTPVAW
jgi:hypothetical protein